MSAPGKARRHLLQNPFVAVGIVERGEGAIAVSLGVGTGHASGSASAVKHTVRVVEDLTDVDPAPGEFGPRLFDVGDDEVQPDVEPGAAALVPVPKMTDADDPGGVTWTTRKSGPVLKSASSRQPSDS